MFRILRWGDYPELSGCVCVLSFVTPCTVARWVPLSMEFSRQKYWSHFLLQGIFRTQGSNLPLLRLLHWQKHSLPLALPGKPKWAQYNHKGLYKRETGVSWVREEDVVTEERCDEVREHVSEMKTDRQVETWRFLLVLKLEEEDHKPRNMVASRSCKRQGSVFSRRNEPLLDTLMLGLLTPRAIKGYLCVVLSH